ncbi:MAG TPA: ABC transporter permease subunit [Aggregatilinea sp.]|uniref:ABC transporter permease subunit n=1 Tax=Aggregatilinea sp. TaxID=2806333 RepID=UPI002C67002C|nr:ABC transporter permease subunit [Aggregatilinea sp.]HML24248.1 ABC transporter permease subunit [Aggregatilinea sp.]
MLLAKGLTLDLAVERLLSLLPLLLVAIVATVVLEGLVYLLVAKVFRSRFALPYTLVAPAAAALLIFTVYPFVYNLRLAFSDLRLKTISCYIPNTDITNAECSLGQAAPNAEVAIQTDYQARVEPNETADVAFDLQEGDEVKITGRSSKISNYIRYSGQPVKLNDDGTPSTQLCGADPICVRAFNQYKATVLDIQDERDWWPVQTSSGQTGWVPNNVFFVRDDAPLYADSVGGETVEDTVAAGTSGREVKSARTSWYEIRLDENTTAWVDAELITTSRSFFPADQAEMHDEMSPDSDVVGTATSGEETQLIQEVTLTWYQVFYPLDNLTGWANVQKQATSTIQTFTSPAETTLYAEMDAESNSVAEISAGQQLILVSTNNDTDVTWYHAKTEDGIEGWLTGITPTDVTDVEVFELADGATLLSDTSANSDPVGDVPAGSQVRLVERDDSKDVTWHRIRLDDGTMGWVTVDGEVATNYSTSDTAEAYAEIGGVGDVLAELDEDQRVTVVDDKPHDFSRYQVRLDDGTVGWLNEEPRNVTTTQRDIVLYSLNYGWENFKRVFVRTDPATGDVTGWGRLLQTQNSTFPRLMRTTIAWTVLNVVFHLIFGMILAMMLNRPGLRFRGIYRAIIILPWAIPQPIIALAWKGEFNYQFGFVNALLTQIGLDPVNWLYTPLPAFIAVTFVNIWLGIPFYMVTLLGGLQSIAGEYYEAAEIDGANAWQRFRNVTVPLIRPVAVPIVTLDVIWTFNNFNVIYLITKGEPNESTNILVTALYNAAFGENGQFQLGFAAAFSLIIFFVLFLFASFWVTSSGALKGVYESS